MKILLVNYEYKPQCGGAGLATYNMAYMFQKMGHEVTLLIGWDYTYGKPDMIEGVDTHIIKTKKKNIHQSTAQGMLSFVLKGTWEIRKMTSQKHYDMIQFYFSVPTGILKYGIRNNVPYVISLRGMDIPGFRKDKYKILSMLTRKINRAVVKGAAAVTSLSMEAGRYFTEFSPETHITVIPNAVDYEQYCPKQIYRDKITRFVAVSRLTEFKNLDLMIKAFAEIHDNYPDVILDIYGEGREREKLQQLIVDLEADAYVTLQGYADRAKLIEVLPQYDVFSLMSIGDSFGIVFIEAMSVGLPIICAKAGGPIEIIKDGETGLFASPDDLEDTKRVIKYCIEHPDKMREFGCNGRKVVEKEYSRENVARQHIDLYKSLLDQKSSANG